MSVDLEFFKKLFFHVSDAILVLDHKGRILEANRTVCGLLGIEYEELFKIKIQEILDIDFENRLKALGPPQDQPQEFLVDAVELNRKGRKCYLRIKGTLLDHQNQSFVFLTMIDITKNVRRKVELEHFKSIVDMAGEAMFIIDPKVHKYLEVNKTALEMYGYTREEFLALKPGDIEVEFPLHSEEEWREHLEQIRETGRFLGPGLNRRKDGSLFRVEVSITHNDFQGEELLFVLVRDVTKDLELIEDLKKLHRAVDQSPASVVVTDVSGKIEYVNPVFSKLTGYSFEEALGQNPRILKSGNLPDQVYEELWNTILNKKTWKGEFHNLKKNGEPYWESATISPILNEEGDITHFIAVKEDITQRKLMEEDLRRSHEELKRLNQSLEKKIQDEVDKNREKDRLMFQQSRFAQMGELLSMIAHQWRQPLNAISTAAIEIALMSQMGDATPDSLKELSDFIQSRSQYMSQTINVFMDYFKPEKEKKMIHCKEVVDNLNEIIIPQLEEYHIPLEFNYDADFQFWGYHKEIEQVLINLIANSRDAYQSKKISDKPIKISISSEDSMVVFSVEDEAGGIPQDLIERIFDPYFTTKEYGKGTGIGLYLSKSIIEKSFNGTIEAQNTNTGVRFDIKIPFQASPIS